MLHSTLSHDEGFDWTDFDTKNAERSLFFFIFDRVRKCRDVVIKATTNTTPEEDLMVFPRPSVHSRSQPYRLTGKVAMILLNVRNEPITIGRRGSEEAIIFVACQAQETDNKSVNDTYISLGPSY
jgi:hypothetical protein